MMNLEHLGKKILVGLISHNRYNFTLKALETLTNTNIPFDLLIVDNGSEIDTKKKLHDEALKYGAHFISIENRNCNGARDLINHYGLNYDYIIYLDNDAIMPSHWLERLIHYSLETEAGLIGVSQSEIGNKETFYGSFNIKDNFILFEEEKEEINIARKVDWVSGHCLMVTGEFLRLIWTKYKLWERRFYFPIDLDDIDLMMMAKAENIPVFAAPIIIPQNRDFKCEKDSNDYNNVRNDFHNYAQSCVSFWEKWNLNPLLNWNKGYSGNIHKSGFIHDSELMLKFDVLVEMLKDQDEELFLSFQKKLCYA